MGQAASEGLRLTARRQSVRSETEEGLGLTGKTWYELELTRRTAARNMLCSPDNPPKPKLACYDEGRGCPPGNLLCVPAAIDLPCCTPGGTA